MWAVDVIGAGGCHSVDFIIRIIEDLTGLNGGDASVVLTGGSVGGGRD